MGLVRVLIAATAIAILPSLGAAQTGPPQVHRLKPEYAAYFETSFEGSITCHIPQHYAFRKFYDLNLRLKDNGAEPFPKEFVDHLNSDDIYSVFAIHEGGRLFSVFRISLHKQ